MHPLTPYTEREKLERLQRIPFTRLIIDSTDNIPLYVIADHILCDYGGPLFGALYTDRNVLLLNVPNAVSNELTGRDSPDILVRQALSSIDPQAVPDLGVLIEDSDLWERQIVVRRELRRAFFAPHYGHASQVAAMALLNLEALLDLG